MDGLNLRGFPDDMRDEAKRRASARGLTLAPYFVALMKLHENLLAQASSDADVQAILNEVGLGPVVS